MTSTAKIAAKFEANKSLPAFIEALRACGQPSRLDQIHDEHRKTGGKYTYAAFRLAAWDLTNDQMIEVIPNSRPRIYTLPNGALDTQRPATASPTRR